MAAIFREIFGIFRGSSKCLFIHPTFSRGTPDDMALARGWETLLTREVTVVEAIGRPVV
jgi:hypothetical protein